MQKQWVYEEDSTESTVVRAQSWDEIFSSELEAELAFQQLISEHKLPDYSYRIEKINGDEVHVFTHTIGYVTTIFRMDNGNIRLTFQKKGEPETISIIEPQIGNISHPYTLPIIVPQFKLLPDWDETGVSRIFIQRIKGKPAISGWEKIYYDHFREQVPTFDEYPTAMPLRVGYKIYDRETLSAYVYLRKYFPKAFRHDTKRKKELPSEL